MHNEKKKSVPEKIEMELDETNAFDVNETNVFDVNVRKGRKSKPEVLGN